MNNRIVTFLGIPGAGKDYAIRKYMDVFGEKYDFFHFSEELKRQIAEVTGQTISNDSIANLDERIIGHCVEKTIEQAIHRQPTIMNYHLLLKKGDEYACNEKYEHIIKSAAYLHLFTDPLLIFQRRLGDNLKGKRNRSLETVEQIRLFQESSMECASRIAKKLGADYYVVQNDTPNLVIDMDRIFDKYIEGERYAGRTISAAREK